MTLPQHMYKPDIGAQALEKREKDSKKAAIDFVNNYYGQPVNSTLIRGLEAMLEKHGAGKYLEGLKDNMDSKGFNAGWQGCKKKSIQVANAWHDPKYPQAAGSHAARGIRIELEKL